MELKLINKSSSDAHASNALEQLATLIEQETDIVMHREHGTPPTGMKTPVLEGLTLIVSVASVLVSVIVLWRSTQTNYVITIQAENQSLSIETKNKQEAITLLQASNANSLLLLLEEKEANIEEGESKKLESELKEVEVEEEE